MSKEPTAPPRVPATDDRVRTDGGNSTEGETVPCEELDKAMDRAKRQNTKEEPGS